MDITYFNVRKYKSRASRTRTRLDCEKKAQIGFISKGVYNLFTTSESPKIRIPIVQILCFDFFNDSVTNNLR